MSTKIRYMEGHELKSRNHILICSKIQETKHPPQKLILASSNSCEKFNQKAKELKHTI